MYQLINPDHKSGTANGRPVHGVHIGQQLLEPTGATNNPIPHTSTNSSSPASTLGVTRLHSTGPVQICHSAGPTHVTSWNGPINGIPLYETFAHHRTPMILCPAAGYANWAEAYPSQTPPTTATTTRFRSFYSTNNSWCYLGNVGSVYPTNQSPVYARNQSQCFNSNHIRNFVYDTQNVSYAPNQPSIYPFMRTRSYLRITPRLIIVLCITTGSTLMIQ